MGDTTISLLFHRLHRQHDISTATRDYLRPDQMSTNAGLLMITIFSVFADTVNSPIIFQNKDINEQLNLQFRFCIAILFYYTGTYENATQRIFGANELDV